jgi:hypothetical protein
VAHREQKRSAYRVLVGKPEQKDHFEDLGIDGRIILYGSLRIRNGFIWLRTGISGGAM